MAEHRRTHGYYAMLVKQYGVEESEDASPTARRYSPNKVTSEEV